MRYELTESTRIGRALNLIGGHYIVKTSDSAMIGRIDFD
jgi:hypothetical protein